MKSNKALRLATVTALESIDALVMNADPAPPDIDDLPAINVFVEGFDTNRFTLKSNGWIGNVRLRIVVMVAGGEGLADRLDDLTAEVMDTLINDADWKSCWSSTSSFSVTNDFQVEAEETIGRADITISGVIASKYTN